MTTHTENSKLKTDILINKGDFVRYFLEDINYQVNNHTKSFINFCEAQYNEQVTKVAKSICDNAKEAPIVLLSGPSGSGKTTTAMRLEQLLDSFGFEAHTISLDNYFSELSEQQQQLAKEGKIDLESPDRLDRDFLNTQIGCMLKGETVSIPKYNFENCKREYSGLTLTRKENDIIIFEGTHALNPDVITIDDENCARLYVSIRSHYLDHDSEVRSKTIRLARRMLRDTKTRGRDPIETIQLFDSVNEGEEKFIKPFMHRCNYSIDTLVPYEICVYRSLLLDSIENLPQTDDIKALTKLLLHSASLDDTIIPSDSLVREFIGGSSLKYL